MAKNNKTIFTLVCFQYSGTTLVSYDLFPYSTKKLAEKAKKEKEDSDDYNSIMCTIMKKELI